MRCCPECFAHEWLRDYVKTHSDSTGHCDYCGAWSVPLLEVVALSDAFGNLMGAYRHHDGSIDRLIDLVQGHDVFSEHLYERADAEGAIRLMNDILESGWDDDDGEPKVDASDYYSTRPSEWHDTLAEKWLEFSDDVKRNPAAAHPLDEIFGEDIGRAVEELAVGTSLSRVRPGFVEDAAGKRLPFRDADAGPPPAAKTDDMRASRRGEVVFYGASDDQTAIAECRPATGYLITVSRFRVRRPLRVIDLSRRPPEFNPFVEESLSYWMEFYEMLGVFGEQLGKPLERSDDKADYRPCQSLAEAVRRAGYDGIRYPSAMHPEGTNVVIFDRTAMVFDESRLVRVTVVSVTTVDEDGSS